MRVLTRAGALLAGVVLLFTLGPVTAGADPALYTTPGGHAVGGRLWRTTCDQYSSTVVRCRTEIWATVVQYRNGQYVHENAWTFNNLTYLPSPESDWESNPLATDGEWTGADGRRWRTECRTASTGGDACRTHALSQTVRATFGPDGWQYTPETKWVFNSAVHFSSATSPRVREVPPRLLETAPLTHQGLGPLQIGTLMSDLELLGYAVPGDGTCPWESTGEVVSLGVRLLASADRLEGLVVTSSAVSTAAGISVGDPFAAAEKAYVDYDFHHELKSGRTPVYGFSADLRSNEMLFLARFNSGRFPDPTEPIGSIIVRSADAQLDPAGC